MAHRDKLPKISRKLRENISNHLFDFSENGLWHNAYDQEQREQSSIENGDLDALKESLAESFNGTVGTLSPDPLRNMKNLAIVSITLSSRSAIRGGLSPEVAFSLSDTFINEFEKQTDINELILLERECEYHYCRMVHDIKMQQSRQRKPEKHPLVNQSKDYIFTHLHDKITVGDIAEAIHVNPHYLSDVFRENEGIPLSQYIMQEKITRVKNLLIYSPYSFSEIASYLCFSSQSHLGTQFKKYTGYTLMQYRREFQKDFIRQEQ